MFETLSERLSQSFSFLRNRRELTGENVEEALRQVRQALLEADSTWRSRAGSSRGRGSHETDAAGPRYSKLTWKLASAVPPSMVASSSRASSQVTMPGKLGSSTS
ncbi:MAG: signal recognition particle receptor subunit alpha [Candidatus Eisenbacteria bacterium]|uniref:Signal recognition particle receptor subunit alpha n=1 Tax=Eiseniibacteriota bacterium TaxID=2212470 RepID=A0A956RRH8_UNCEI|nr:signal recognition particle receptor subunit alpha [Candidatus Eisenbacteria bacterium]